MCMCIGSGDTHIHIKRPTSERGTSHGATDQIEHEHETEPIPVHRHTIAIITTIFIIAHSCHCRPAKRIMCICSCDVRAHARSFASTKIKHRHKQIPNASIAYAPCERCARARAIFSYTPRNSCDTKNKTKRKEEEKVAHKCSSVK